MSRNRWLVGAIAVVALTGGLHAGSSPAASTAVTSCNEKIRHDVLPVWMRGGFSGPNPRVPYVIGKRGAVGAVVFGWPLNSPESPGRGNKILWVPRHYSKTIAPFWIRLQLMNGDQPVGAPIRKIIATGPGPSIVDVPTAGCWRLTLSWSGRRDTLDLNYSQPD